MEIYSRFYFVLFWIHAKVSTLVASNLQFIAACTAMFLLDLLDDFLLKPENQHCDRIKKRNWNGNWECETKFDCWNGIQSNFWCIFKDSWSSRVTGEMLHFAAAFLFILREIRSRIAVYLSRAVLNFSRKCNFFGFLCRKGNIIIIILMRQCIENGAMCTFISFN